MASHVIQMSDTELNERLEWIENEIVQLSTKVGVQNRIQALRASRAQLLAVRFINVARARKPDCDTPGGPP